jgi:hypothetical protein
MREPKSLTSHFTGTALGNFDYWTLVQLRALFLTCDFIIDLV